MLLRLEKFGGILPRIEDPALLPEGKSQTSLNCRFDKGGISGYYTDSTIFVPTVTGPILTIYRYYDPNGTGFFLAWDSDVDAVKAPLLGDQYDRVFYIEDGVLKVTDKNLYALGGTAYPMSYVIPSPPAPAQAITATGSASGSDPTLLRTVGWCYTYVNSYGEEGPPSPVSNLLSLYDSNSADLADIAGADPTIKLLLHCDGAPGDNIADTSLSSHGNATKHNGADIENSVSAFGSGALGTNGGYISYPASTDWELGSPNWVYEFELLVGGLDETDHKASGFLELIGSNGDRLSIFIRYLDIAHAWYMGAELKVGSATTLIVSDVPLPFQFNHIALIAGWGGNPNQVALTVNGIAGSGTAILDTFPDLAGADLIIGQGTTLTNFDIITSTSILDEICIRKVTPWISTFTQPAHAYADPAISTALYNLTSINIYRINQSLTGAQFQFVDQIPISSTSYTDAKADSALGEVLPSLEWDGPPEGVKGLIALPNGVLACFVGNRLCLSPKNYPHAWPASYQKATDRDIVSLGSHGNTVIITTKGQPYGVVCDDPSNTVMEKIDGLANVSKRSTVQVESLGLVAYASPEGIMTIGAQTPMAQLATAEVITREQWNDKYNPSTISAYYWQGKYIGFYTTLTTQAGFMFDFITKDLVDLDFYATAGYHDPIDGRLYLQIGDEIMSFSDTETLRTFNWLSKRFRFLPTSFGWLQVIGSIYPITVDIIMRDKPATLSINVLSKKPIRPGRTGLIDNCEVRIFGTGRVSALYLATTSEELPL